MRMCGARYLAQRQQNTTQRSSSSARARACPPLRCAAFPLPLLPSQQLRLYDNRCKQHQQQQQQHRSVAAFASSGQPGGSGSSDGDADDAPPVLGDWRAFRARLVQQQQQQQAGAGAAADAAGSGSGSGSGGGGGDSDAPLRAGARSEENMALLAAQDPVLAAEDVWAHATPGPERGGLLIATADAPRVLGSERYWQVVALIVSHDAAGTVALILNRPSGLVLGRKQGGLPFAMAGGPPGLQQIFAENRVYCGGFLAQQVIHVLHGHKLPGAMEIAPGIYCGGEVEAVARVAAGELPASSFKFFAGAVAFEPGELEAQLKAGAWLTAAAARPLILKQVLQLPKPLWREVLGLMGGGFAAMARAAAEDEVDE